MTDEEQRQIFSRNLRHFVALTGKQQRQVAEELGVGITTFNTWCVGHKLPSLPKIRNLAEYFKINVTDLMDGVFDDKIFKIDVNLLSDIETLKMVKKFYELNEEDKKAIRQMINSLYEKTK